MTIPDRAHMPRRVVFDFDSGEVLDMAGNRIAVITEFCQELCPEWIQSRARDLVTQIEQGGPMVLTKREQSFSLRGFMVQETA